MRTRLPNADRRPQVALLLAAAAALSLFRGRAAAAGEDGPGNGLGLADVVQATLASSPEIRLAQQQAEAFEGALVASRAPFDLLLSASGGAWRRHEQVTFDGQARSAIQQTQSYRVGLQRLLRNGVLVTPELTLARAGYSILPGAEAANNAALGLTVAVPLMRDRGGAVSAGPERAATLDHRASLLDLRHTMAERVLVAVVAYWDYLAAQRRLTAFVESEQRAERTANETRVLVEADERTAADLTQVLGNLSAKRVSRIAAEQEVVEARRDVGLAMGVPADAVATLAAPGTDFPVVDAAQARPLPADLLAQAYARRADLAAAEQEVRSAEALLEAAESDVKPRLDLVGGARSGTREFGLGFQRFFSPLSQAPRVDTSLQLVYEFPTATSLARGNLLQTSAVLEQRRILEQDLRRRIAAEVAVAAQALARGEAGMRESEEAVRLAQSTVDAEQRKFQLGVSTAFDVTQSQDALTSAVLGRIRSQQSYAVAIATLRFHGGTLVQGDDGRPAVDLDSLAAPP